MSADNWAICPHCVKHAHDRKARREEAANEAYGKAPIEEYMALRDMAAEIVNEEQFRTFREDYEFYGAETGEVMAVYSGRCEKCGASAAFKSGTHKVNAA